MEGGYKRVIETQEMTCVLDQFIPPAFINKPVGPDKGEVSIKLVFPFSRDDHGFSVLSVFLPTTWHWECSWRI